MKKLSFSWFYVFLFLFISPKLFAQKAATINISELNCSRSIGGSQKELLFMDIKFTAGLPAESIKQVQFTIVNGLGQKAISLTAIAIERNGSFYLNLGNHGESELKNNAITGSILIPKIFEEQNLNVTVKVIAKDGTYSNILTSLSPKN